MFGVAACEVFFHLSVALFPEASEVFGHLPGSLIRRANVDEKRQFSANDAGRFPGAEEMLHFHGNVGIALGGVDDFRFAVGAEFDALRRMLL